MMERRSKRVQAGATNLVSSVLTDRQRQCREREREREKREREMIYECVSALACSVRLDPRFVIACAAFILRFHGTAREVLNA